MKSYRPITLMAQPPTSPRGGSSAYVISVLAHVGGCFALFFGLSHTPQIDGRTMAPRFTIRILNLSAPKTPVQQQSAGNHDARSLPQVAASDPSAGGSPAPVAPAAPQLAQLIHQNQTLVQPDAPSSLLIPRVTPAVFMWTPDSTPIKPVVEAPTQKSIVAMLRPSLEPPNRELNLSDIRMSSTNMASALRPIRSSTTSPIVVREPEPARQMPETASKAAAEPTPARILSLSDLRAQEGPVEIPLANATGRPTESNSLSEGRAMNPAEAGHGKSANNQPGVGLGQAAGLPLSKVQNRSVGDAQLSSNSGPGQDAVLGPNLGGLGPVTRINLPKDGQFGVVVVGSSLADQYPEIADTWSGRLVYTVYLHAGAGKSWILQYSLAQAAQVPIAASNGRPDAPWPYEIVRPRFDNDDVNADSLMVHGFVNLAGRFERLALVYPADFVKAKFLLAALQEWQFRPARQNGKPAPVEVLLIIPAEAE